MAKTGKESAAMQETHVGSLGQEDPLEKGMATQSSILAWKLPWTEEPGGLQSLGLQRVEHDWVTKRVRNMLQITQVIMQELRFVSIVCHFKVHIFYIIHYKKASY